MALAHEGNPKTDSITIKAGEITSEATLEIDIWGRAGGGAESNLVPPLDSIALCPYITATRTVDDCAAGYIVDGYDDGSYFPVAKVNGTQPNCESPPSLSFFPTLPYWDFSIRSGNTQDQASILGVMAGFTIWSGVPDDSVDYNAVSANFTILSGSPRTGFCYWVDPLSTPCNFTGVVCMFDVQANATIFGYYINQDLHDENPTILATGALPTQGGVYSFLTLGVNPGFELFDDLIEVMTYGDLTALSTLVTPTPVMGIFWAGNADAGIHAARWDAGVTGDKTWQVL